MIDDEKIPDWIHDEVNDPIPMGEGRNDQMIRIGPTLVRAGYDADTLFELFCTMYGDLEESQWREVAAVCRQSVRYAAKEDAQLMKGEFIERKKVLNALAMNARQELPSILDDFAWPFREMAAKRPFGFEYERVQFLIAMFGADDVVWIGQVWETGVRERRGVTVDYSTRFKTVREWLGSSIPSRSEFTSHCTFLTGTSSRCNEAVADHRYMVVESDVLAVDDVLAVFNYLNQHQGLTLKAIVSTGGKSLHGWFDWPAQKDDAQTMEEWSAVLQGLKCDPSTLRPSQPVRLPGTTRSDTQRPQELLWLA